MKYFKQGNYTYNDNSTFLTLRDLITKEEISKSKKIDAIENSNNKTIFNIEYEERSRDIYLSYSCKGQKLVIRIFKNYIRSITEINEEVTVDIVT